MTLDRVLSPKLETTGLSDGPKSLTYKNSNKIHAQELEIKKGCTGTIPDVQTKTRLFNVANLYVCVFCVPKEK